MKKILSLFMSIVMLLSITAGLDLTANAQVLTGNCGAKGDGSNVTYTLDTNTGVLTISGTGGMKIYFYADAPWYSNRSSVKIVIINLGVTSIGFRAFYDCSSLISVTIPNSVTSIGGEAFSYCSSLTSITIPDSVTVIGNYAFSRCSSLTSITIPKSVDCINYRAFCGCDSLTSVTIPDSVTCIGYAPFSDCSSLTNITVDSNNQYYFSQDGVLFNKDKTNLIQYPAGNTRTSYEIPNSVTSIGEGAFSSCGNLTNIAIPDSVTTIGEYAFSDCSSLTDVYYSGTKEQWKKISIYSGNYCLTNATIHYNSVMPDIPTIPDLTPQSFKVGSHTYNGDYGFYYTDEYFNTPATKYNHSLATMSLCLALSTYQDDEKDIYYENVKNVYSKCGFDVEGADSTFEQKNYLVETGTDTIGCTFANKKIGDETLIVIAVRSGGYGKEWASNVTVGLSGDHQGFDDASSKVYTYLADYVNSRNITGKVKFWITGFSRGGATANLLAAKLDNTIDSHPDITYGKDDVYAYTFATPAGANKSNNPHSSKYNNIFNIIHYHDVVPLVAPSQTGWGFDRYGITKVFSFHENSRYTNDFEQHMQEYLTGIGYEYKVNDFRSYINIAGYPKVQENNYDSLGTFNRKFIKSVATQIGTRHTYTISYQTELRAFFAKNALSIASGVLSEVASNTLIKMLAGEAVLHPCLTATALMEYDLMAVVHADCANYLAWMMSMDKNYDKNNEVFFTNGDYRVVKVNCPVDVNVYDSENNLVASIIDEIPQEVEGSSIISSIDENEQKVVYLPVDGDYRVEVIAREDCQTTYTINEYTGLNADVSKIISYSSVDMEKDETMISNVDAYSQDEIDSQEGATDGSTAEYTLELNNNLLSPNVKATGEEVQSYTYNVDVSYDENQGEIVGGGQFTEGDFCLLTATNNVGYIFDGWYVDDAKISSESSYRFEVKESSTVEGRFVPCSHSNCTFEVIAPKCEEQGYTIYTCTVCEDSYIGDYTSPTGHSFNGGKNCVVCGAVNPNYVDPTTTTTPQPTTTQPTTTATVQTTTPPAQTTTSPAQIATTSTTVKKPKSTSISKLTKGKKQFKVAWKKVSGVAGYQIQYSTDKKFKKNVKNVTAKKSSTSATIKKLKSKKTYYVRIRTYKTVKINGKSTKVYSSWSKVKTVKTK